MNQFSFWVIFKKIFNILVFATCILCNLSGQLDTIIYKRYGIEDGLPTESLYKLLKDQNGYLWIATTNGLVHFDGGNFTTIPQGSDFGNVLGAKILEIHKYGDNKIVLGTDRGLSVIDINTFATKNITLALSPKTALDDDYVRQMIPSNSGGFWCMTRTSIYFLDYNLSKKLHFGLPIGIKNGFPALSSPRMVELDNGNLLFIDIQQVDPYAKNYMYEYDVKSNSLKQKKFSFLTDLKKFSGIIRVSKEEILIIDDQVSIVKTYIWNTKTNKVSYLPFPENFVKYFYSPFFDYNGSLAINIFESKKIYVLNLPQMRWEVKDASKIPGSILISSYCEIDQKNSYWLPLNGLYFENKAPMTPYNLLYKQTKNNFNWNYVESKLEINDSIVWIVEKDAKIISYNIKSGKYQYLLENFAEKEKGNYIKSIFQFEKGKSIFLNTHLGIRIFNLETNKIENLKGFKNKPDVFDSVYLNCQAAKDGSIWVNIQGTKLYRIFPELKEVIAYEDEAISNTYYTAIEVDSKGNTYFVTPKVTSILIYQEAEKRFKKIIPMNEKNEPTTNISGLLIDNFDNVWLFTDGYGMHLFDTKTNKITKSITTQQGLNNNYIVNQFKDKNGNFWIKTISGLNFFDPVSLKLSNISSNMPMSVHTGFNFMDPDNRFMLTNRSNNRMVYDVDELLKPRKFERIDIIKIEKNGKMLALQDEELQVESRTNSVIVYFRYKDLLEGKENKYFYKSTSNPDWTELLKGNKFSLNDLKPGTNKVHMKVCFENGECDIQKVVEIYKQPLLWERAWFWPLLFVFISTGAFFIFRLQLKNRNANIDKLTLELQFLQTKMNPHFIFNGLNSINRFILRSDQLSASEYLSKFAKLIRTNFDNSSSLLIPLIQEIEMLKIYLNLESLRFKEKFEYTIDIDPNLNLEKIMMPPLLIQPFVENAIWHGLLPKKSDCELKIFLKNEAGLLAVIIIDNGIGRKKAEEIKNNKIKLKTSEGVNTTLNRLKTFEKLYGIKTDLEIIDLEAGTEALGTKVVITFDNILNLSNEKSNNSR